MIQTAERVSTQLSDNYVYQRSLLAYHYAANIIHGNVLEIGTGEGYGIEMISSKATQFTTVDQFVKNIDFTKYSNVQFKQITVPPFTGLMDDTYDFVITFQVIEHIENDLEFLKEIYRVLKPGGKLIVSTPNILTTLTRNPWHVREYKHNELTKLSNSVFLSTETLGTYGNETIMNYYNKNKEAIKKITRFDIFNLQYLLPRRLLQIPYDLLNRYNRKKLLSSNYSLTSGIKMSDFSIAPVNDQCLDLYYICTK